MWPNSPLRPDSPGTPAGERKDEIWRYLRQNKEILFGKSVENAVSVQHSGICQKSRGCVHVGTSHIVNVVEVSINWKNQLLSWC